MHVNLLLEKDVFGYKKGEIIPALKYYDNLREDYTYIVIANTLPNEYDVFFKEHNSVKEVDYIKKVINKADKKAIFIVYKEHAGLYWGTNENGNTMQSTNIKQWEEIPVEENIPVINYAKDLSNTIFVEKLEGLIKELKDFRNELGREFE